jgi:hypothetical protein
VLVFTPVTDPVQLKGTMYCEGLGSLKNTVRFPKMIVASGIVNVYGKLSVPEQKPVVVTLNVP